jgi:hypothetical protein
MSITSFGSRSHEKEKAVRKSKKLPKRLQYINQYAADIDVGSRSHFVAVPEDVDEQPVREFSTFTSDLERLAESCGLSFPLLPNDQVSLDEVVRILI